MPLLLEQFSDLRTASTEGKNRTRTVADQRRKLGDTTNVDILERLEVLSEEEFHAMEHRWHKTCYFTFTSESTLSRLKKQGQSSAQLASHHGLDPCSSTTSVPTRRSTQRAMNWSLCMFCQEEGKRKVHRVETLEKSAELIERSKLHPVMSSILSGVSDLIAAEGCYHLACLVSFERHSARPGSATESQQPVEDECMMMICRDLCVGLSRGHVYDMSDVYDRYERMSSEMGKCVPPKYQSRRTTFYEAVQELVGPKASYVKPLSRGSLLMYPGDKSDFFISRTLTKSIEPGMFSSESESTEDEDGGTLKFAQGKIFQEMVHVALRVRQDLLDTPGHSSTWHGLDQEHVDQVIPESLYMFLCLLFGGINNLYEETDEDNTIKQTVCNIAKTLFMGCPINGS